MGDANFQHHTHKHTLVFYYPGKGILPLTIINAIPGHFFGSFPFSYFCLKNTLLVYPNVLMRIRFLHLTILVRTIRPHKDIYI